MLTPLSELKRKASPERQLHTEREVHELLQQIAEREARKAARKRKTREASSSEVNSVNVTANMSVEALDRYVFSLGARLEMRAVFPDKTVVIQLSDAAVDEPQSRAA